MENINYNNLNIIVKSYKEKFEDYREKEMYKWKAIKTFQANWNIDAENFTEMLKESLNDSANLLSSSMYFPKSMIIQFSEKEQEKTREMFRTLFDETIELKKRYDVFVNIANEILSMHWEKGKNHYQDAHAISTYLTFKFPEKYYMYKFSIDNRIAKYLGINIYNKDKATELENYFELANGILEYIKKDNELIKLHKNMINDEHYADENLHVLTWDLLFYGGVTLLENDKNENKDKEVKQVELIDGEYYCDIDITIEEWRELLGNKEIFTEERLDIIKKWYSQPQHKSSCKEMTEKYGNTPNYYNNLIWQLGKKVCKELNRFTVIGTDLQLTYWIIIMKGRYGSKYFDWELREELLNALEIEKIVECDESNSRNIKSYDKYDKKDFLKDVFISEHKYDELVNLLKRKQNIILQGAPGVGKTFMAKRLAYSIMREKDNNRIKCIQFHQSYCYEDFIEGFRPTDNSFKLEKGIFYDFCKQAENNLDKEYFFLIDEINRGNLSKIFGELLMLIENDKRGQTLQLAYSKTEFSVPKNLYIIGMMNTADRSLALIDYALRRRFAFYTVVPAFDSEQFKNYQDFLKNKKFNDLIKNINSLNIEIEKDSSLGNGFKIGHSYFCNLEKITDVDIESIILYEILPLIEEYWFDDIDKYNIWKDKLNGVLNG